MTKYQQTLQYLYHQLPMYQRVGASAFKKDLTNIRVFCEALGNPQEQFPAIHLAGTNGKGSTAHIIAAVLQAGGLRTGLYTSPHYKDFRERIKIDGAFVSRKWIVAFVEQHRALLEELRPSFFEITVAMAFAYFAAQEVDVAVIETGLGGRLDSTNIIMPLISVITNISLDHQKMLGDTLPEIAGEKAGIIKAGVPVVIGETQEEVRAVFERKAAQMAAPLTFADQHFKLEEVGQDAVHSRYKVYQNDKLLYENLAVNLTGNYQVRNLVTAMQALSVLEAEARLPQSLLPQAWTEGLKAIKPLTTFMGRWQLLGESPIILCDSAHNIGGLELAMAHLRRLEYEELHIVLGMVNDKAPEAILRLFPQAARYYFAKADIPRGLEAERLRASAAALGLRGRAYSSVRNALRAAKRRAKPEDLIYVGGSIFVVGEVI
ncbi:MAG: folylpolyglutamate synthase/dihydrofolate synthase family protein [Bacteroidota bacterium]